MPCASGLTAGGGDGAAGAGEGGGEGGGAPDAAEALLEGLEGGLEGAPGPDSRRSSFLGVPPQRPSGSGRVRRASRVSVDTSFADGRVRAGWGHMAGLGVAAFVGVWARIRAWAIQQGTNAPAARAKCVLGWFWGTFHHCCGHTAVLSCSVLTPFSLWSNKPGLTYNSLVPACCDPTMCVLVHAHRCRCQGCVGGCRPSRAC